MSDTRAATLRTTDTTGTSAFIAAARSGLRNGAQVGAGFSDALGEVLTLSTKQADDLSSSRNVGEDVNAADRSPVSRRDDEPVRPRAARDSSSISSRASDSSHGSTRDESEPTAKADARQNDQQGSKTVPTKQTAKVEKPEKTGTKQASAQGDDIDASQTNDLQAALNDAMTSETATGVQDETQENGEAAPTETKAAKDDIKVSDLAALFVNAVHTLHAQKPKGEGEARATDATTDAAPQDATQTDTPAQNAQLPSKQELRDLLTDALHGMAAAPTESEPTATDGAEAANQNEAPSFDPTAQNQTTKNMAKADWINLAKQADSATAPVRADAAPVTPTAAAQATTSTGAVTTTANATGATTGVSGPSATGIAASAGKAGGVYEAHAASNSHSPRQATTLTPAEQVAVQLHKQAKSGTDKMTIQLRPDDLGRIEIKLDFGADKTVTGRVIVDNPQTLDMLTKDAGSLQRALQDAGLQANAGSLEFSLRGDNGQQNFMAQQRNNNGFSSSSSSSQTDGAGDVETATTETYYIAPGRVNLRV